MRKVTLFILLAAEPLLLCSAADVPDAATFKSLIGKSIEVYLDSNAIEDKDSKLPEGMIVFTPYGKLYRGTLNRNDAATITLSAPAVGDSYPDHRASITIPKSKIKRIEKPSYKNLIAQP